MTPKCGYKANWNKIEVKFNFGLIDLNQIRGRQPTSSIKLYSIFGKFCRSHSALFIGTSWPITEMYVEFGVT